MDHFLKTYTALNHSNLHLLDTIYTEDIYFVDPAHAFQGLAKLTAYFQALYANLNAIEFNFTDPLKHGDIAYVQWNMAFSHPKLQRGKVIEVPGATFLRFHSSGKVSYHRDHFDLGCMLYEHLPVLGKIISGVKRRLGS